MALSRRFALGRSSSPVEAPEPPYRASGAHERKARSAHRPRARRLSSATSACDRSLERSSPCTSRCGRYTGGAARGPHTSLGWTQRSPSPWFSASGGWACALRLSLSQRATCTSSYRSTSCRGLGRQSSGGPRPLRWVSSSSPVHWQRAIASARMPRTGSVGHIVRRAPVSATILY